MLDAREYAGVGVRTRGRREGRGGGGGGGGRGGITDCNWFTVIQDDHPSGPADHEQSKSRNSAQSG